MGDIVEIVHRLTFDVVGQGLDKAITKLKEQASAINNQKKELDELQRYYTKLPSGYTQLQQKLQADIEKRTKAIERQTKVLEESFNGNKKLQSALREEIGLIEQLTQFISQAGKEMAELTDPQQVRAFASEIRLAQRELANLTGYGGKPGLTVQKQQELEDLRRRNALLTNPADIARGNQAEKALENQISNLRKLGTEGTKAVGIIGQINKQIDVLNQKKLVASEKEMPELNRQVAELQGRLDRINKSGIPQAQQVNARGSALSQIKGSVLSGLGVGVGFGLLSQGVSEAKEFVREARQLAKETEGVQIAFANLNKPNLLSNLRASVKGTISDLELMKQANLFDSFKLPVEELPKLFEFARVRARALGVETKTVVDNIVNGIARQSPRILDNFGLSQIKIRERFKETGDFAEAAFQIIAEESAAAGEQIDIFADKQERANAKIQNLKATIGGFFNAIVVGSVEGTDSLLGFLGGTDSFSAEFARQQKLVEDVLKKSNEDKLSDIEKYNRDYESLDEIGRRTIENQARDSYNELSRLQQKFFNSGLISAGEALQGQLNQYIGFFSKIRAIQGNKKVGFNQFSQTELLGMSQSELKDLRKSGTDELDDLILANDTKRIAEIKSRVAQIDRVLDRFSLTVKKTKAKVKKDTIKPNFIFSFEDLEESEAELEKYTDAMERRLQEADKLIKRVSDRMGKSSVETEIEAGQEQSMRDRGMILPDAESVSLNQSITNQKRQDAEDAARKKRIEKNKEEVNAYLDGYQTIVDAAINAFSLINQAQLLSIDTEISIREKRVDAAVRLAEKGNAELLNVEREALENAQRERERIARRQIAINAALQVSNSLVAVARAASEGGGYGSIALIAAVVAALASGYGAVKSLNVDSAPAFKDGVVGFKGKGNGTSDSNHVRISSGESVITAKGTERNKRVLEMINAGHKIEIPAYNTPVIQRGDKVDTKRLEKKFDKMIGAYEQTGMNVTTRLDANGFYQKSERNVYKNKQRYAR